MRRVEFAEGSVDRIQTVFHKETDSDNKLCNPNKNEVLRSTSFLFITDF